MCQEKINAADSVHPVKDFAAITAQMVEQGMNVTQAEVEETMKNCKGQCDKPCWASNFPEKLQKNN